MTSAPDLSVIIPCYNEGKTLAELCHRLTATFSSLKEEYELVLVNDDGDDHHHTLDGGLPE